MMKNQKSAQNTAKKTISNQATDKRRLLAEPMPQEWFEYIKEKILSQGPWITRIRLCKIFPLFKRNTLRNWDDGLKGIPGKINVGPKQLACYPTQNTVDFIEEMFCKRPLQTQEDFENQEENETDIN